MPNECRVCGGPLDPDLAYAGMHPECEGERYNGIASYARRQSRNTLNYRMNLR